jgi:hypothetical protein
MLDAEFESRDVDGAGYEFGAGGGTQEIIGTPNAGISFGRYLW